MSDTSLTTVADMFKTKEQIAVIKNTVAKGATDSEFAMLCHLAKKYNLDPFAREIYFIKYGGQPTIMTSRDGYLKVAQTNPDFLLLKNHELLPLLFALGLVHFELEFSLQIF